MLGVAWMVAAGFTGPAPADLRARGLARAASPDMQLFGLGKKSDTEKLPKGWKKVPSRSRPGEFSYENIKTGQVYSDLPRSAFMGGGGEFFDDEKDTTAKPLWQWNAKEKEQEYGGFRSAGAGRLLRWQGPCHRGWHRLRG